MSERSQRTPRPGRLDPAVVDAYRRRRAPAGFAARVAAGAGTRRRTPPLLWRSAAAVGLAAGSALVLVLVTRPHATQAPEIGVPPAPDYWAEISVPLAPPVSGLADFGAVPALPPRPELDAGPGDPDQRSSAPRPGDTQLSQSKQQETSHEAV